MTVPAAYRKFGFRQKTGSNFFINLAIIVMGMEQIRGSRLKRLNDKRAIKGKYILYWMQQSQRAEWNHALEYAIQRANETGLPLVAGFGLTDNYPEANLRHYRFMLEGLRETQHELGRRGIRLIVRRGNPDDIALKLGEEASLIICDRGYLRHQKAWRKRVAEKAKCEVTQVETDVVVPVEVVSGKAETGARTLRPKIHKHLDDYLSAIESTRVVHDSLGFGIYGEDLHNPDDLLQKLKIDRSVPPVPFFRGGASEARKLFEEFLENRLKGYCEHRNRPETDYVSHMSKYLHFGQISPLYLALKIINAENIPRKDRDCYLEELLVRRELAQNFVHFTENYDSFECLPPWARVTLNIHRDDERPYRYSKERLETAGTHDPYWNAAMREMKYTGYMHNYMRMYWGKKILEWSETPEQAYKTALELNNKYFIDGRDPNAFAGIGWVFGLHDRPWPERKIFGNVRFMSAEGLKRKADADAYIGKVENLVRTAGRNRSL